MNDKEAKERELKEQRARELEREAERERERQREKEIRAFRDFSTKLPIKQTRRSRGSSFIMEQQQQQQESNGKIAGGSGPSQPSSLHPQYQSQSQQNSNMIAPIMPWNSSGPMNGSFNGMPSGQGYGHLGPLTDPSQLKSLNGPGPMAAGFEPLAYPG